MPKHLTEREKNLRLITEAQWQVTVEEILAANGWLVWHDKGNSRRGQGAFNRPGLLDIIAVRMEPADFLMAELKRETGKLRPEQEQWLRLLGAAGIDCYVWRPSDAEEVKQRAQRVYEL